MKASLESEEKLTGWRGRNHPRWPVAGLKPVPNNAPNTSGRSGSRSKGRAAFNAICSRPHEAPTGTPIQLMTTNAMTDQVNHAHQERLSRQAQVYAGDIRGSFGERQLPTHEELRLQVGARVMLLSNDEDGRWINGALGRIEALAKPDQVDPQVTVSLDRGKRVKVSRYTWEVVSEGQP